MKLPQVPALYLMSWFCYSHELLFSSGPTLWFHLTLITSQRLHLLITSHWGLGLQHKHFVGTQSSQNTQSHLWGSIWDCSGLFYTQRRVCRGMKKKPAEGNALWVFLFLFPKSKVTAQLHRLWSYPGSVWVLHEYFISSHILLRMVKRLLGRRWWHHCLTQFQLYSWNQVRS